MILFRSSGGAFTEKYTHSQVDTHTRISDKGYVVRGYHHFSSIAPILLPNADQSEP